MRSIAIACFLSLSSLQSAYSQLEVETNGNVKVSKCLSVGTTTSNYIGLNLYKYAFGNTQPYYGIKSYVKSGSYSPIGNMFAIHGHSDLSIYSSNSSSQYFNQACGVVGEVTNSSSSGQYVFCAGVAGVVNNSGANGGIGVLGTIKQGYAIPTTSLGLWAGYFRGSVKVTGALTASSVTTTSDLRLKDNVNYIEYSEAKNLLSLLRPVSYYFKQDADSTQYIFEDSSKVSEQLHYGLIAQEVQKVAPNIVYENSDGYLSINYLELIPLMLKTIQELSSEVKELKAIVNDNNKNTGK